MSEQNDRNDRMNENPGLSAKQQAVLARLLKGKIPADLKVKTIPKRQVFSPVPLSFSQRRLWVLDRLVPGNAIYNIPSAALIKGVIDLPVFERAINESVRRHESLRTIFKMENEEPVQVILPELTLQLKTIDLRHLPGPEQDPAISRLLEEEAGQPFDLGSGPLLRVLMLVRDEHTHILMYNIHHIISDTWSNELLMKEWMTIYDAFIMGKPSPLPGPVIQYADFAVWQSQNLQGEVLAKQLSYWKNILSGDIPILELPTDHPRPVISSYRGRKQALEIPGDLTARLSELTRKKGCSMFMTLLTAFNILLYRYSGQDDILVGSPVANRTKPELEKIIGFFSNTIVIRSNLAGGPTFSRLLERVRSTLTRAYDNQDLPFEKLVEELHPDRYMNHNPLFQVMLVLQNVPKQAVEMANKNIEFSYYPAFSGAAKFDLWLSLTQFENKIPGVIEYSIDIFEDDTIARFCTHFKNLLEELVRDPEQGIDDIPYLSAEEKEQLLSGWNDTGKAYNLRPLHKMFESQAEKTPDHTALVGADLCVCPRLVGLVEQVGQVGPVRPVRPVNLTYRRLNEQADQLAGILFEKGVVPDTIVAIKLERSVEMVIGLMGILKSGGAYLPIDPELPPDRIAYMLKDSNALFLIDETFFRGSRGAILQKSPPCSANLAYLIYTSGSTGKPKGVMVKHEGVSNRLQWMQDVYGLTPDDRVLQKTPYSFDVSVWEFFWTLSVGAVLVMAKPGGHKDSAYLVRVINREKITTIHFVPTMLNVFLEDPGIDTIRTLKRVICSGEALPVEYREKFFKHFASPVELHNLYGPTEASVDVTYWACERNTNRHTVPIGKPIANTQIYILDPNQNIVPIGIRGELCISGIQLAQGYINKPELTNKSFCGGSRGAVFSKRAPLVYHTGDLARWLPDGTIEYIGRLDYQVKVRGFRIELEEIESNLREHRDVANAVVLVTEKKLVAYVVPQNGTQVETLPGDFAGEQVGDWQNVFDNTYSGDPGPGDPTFNIAGWNSSYTGGPLPAEEMRTWVESTVARILTYQPQNIMEIGCGTGLFLFRIIPHCRRYLGTDIAREGLNYIDSQLQKIKQPGWANVCTRRRSADNFDEIEDGELDMVILNSVIQYFPSAGYLVDVLEKAAAKIKPGGHIFIGDVRSLPLLKTFHASVEIARAEPGVDKETILRRVLNKIAMEQELVIDSLFFEALKKRIPRIKHVERLIKYGRYTNELSKFRYDIILHIEEEHMELSTLKPGLVIDWQLEKPGIADIENVLSSLANQGTAPGCIFMTSIPNARVARDIDALKQLSGMDEPATVHGFDPNDFLQFADGYPYDISVLVPALPGAEGTFDAVFIHRDLKTKKPGAVVVNSHLSLSPGETSDWNSYTNNPLLVKIAGRLVPQWRDFLKERVPEYMIPSHFVVLDRLPVTANGKLDRRMLPEPVQVNQTGGFTAPATATEIFLAELWKEILNLEQVSTNHNFFELGGDSVNAIQVVSRANKKGVEMNVQLLFRNQTIAGLAGAIEKNRPKILKAGEDTYHEFMKTLDMDAILKQLPPGVEIEDIYPASPLQLHQVHFLETQVIEDPPVYLYQKRNLPMNIRLDMVELEKIVQMVSERYQVLRTVIIWKNLKEPVQVVCKKMKFDLSYHDLTSIAAEEKNQAVNDLLKQDWNHTFDRQNSSPMRVGVFKLDENLYQYYFTGDYLRMEGWSASRFNHEILTYYQILKAGENIPNTAPQPNCYKEYVHTTRLLRKQEENPARQYWQTLFKDFSGMKSLTTLPGNQKGQGVGFGISYFYLSAALSARLEQFLMQNHLSLSPLIQGTWSALLGTYFQQDRVVYGMMTTGRAIPMAGIEHMTGHSINILPVVVPVTKKRTLLEYTRDIRDIQTEWTRYEYTQLEQIAGWLDCPGDGRLFDHYIVIQNLRSALGEIRGMARDNAGWLKNAHLVFAKMEYPLRIDIFPDYEYCFIFQYYPRFLTTAAVKGIMANFKTLIEAILDNPHQTVAEWMKCVAVDKYKLFENEGPDSFVQE